MSQLHGVLEPLEWESQFFGISSAVVRFRDNAPALMAADFAPWQRVQAKISAADADCLDALQQVGFQLVEGEVDLKMAITLSAPSDAERATEQDIPALRQMAALAFAQSRFRAPWYAADDSGRFYAQWIENAVKGLLKGQRSRMFLRCARWLHALLRRAVFVRRGMRRMTVAAFTHNGSKTR
ncbi:dTDP-fucosamine acetyltransferase [compost metagenome]